MNKFLARLAIAAVTLLCAFSISNSASATPSDAIPCAAGSYSSTGYASATESVTCQQTPPGTYQDQTGATSPIPCPAGTFAGVSGLAACVASEPGHYVATIQSVSQLPCDLGSYQPLSGQGYCLQSPAGSFVANAGSAFAAQCRAGSYQPNTGSIACVPADLGTYVATTGATQPTPCPIDFTTATTGAISPSDCNISAVVTILVSPTPTPTPTATESPSPSPTPAPIVMPGPTVTQIPVDLRVQNVQALKIPKTVKVGAKFSFGKAIPVGLAVKATASGSCKVSSSATGYTVTASKTAGLCKLTLTNKGNSHFMPLNAQVALRVVR